jgi:hypothetical protein
MNCFRKISGHTILRRGCWAIFLLFGPGIANLLSQNTLYIKENEGTQASFILGNIKKLTFPEGNLMVQKTDGSTDNSKLSNLRYLSFNNFKTDVALLNVDENTKMSIFPNPASNNLQVSFEGIIEDKVQLEIIDLQGKVLQKQEIAGHNGKTISTISIVHLAIGLYILRVQNGDTPESFRFYKY